MSSPGQERHSLPCDSSVTFDAKLVFGRDESAVRCVSQSVRVEVVFGDYLFDKVRRFGSVRDGLEAAVFLDADKEARNGTLQDELATFTGDGNNVDEGRSGWSSANRLHQSRSSNRHKLSGLRVEPSCRILAADGAGKGKGEKNLNYFHHILCLLLWYTERSTVSYLYDFNLGSASWRSARL